jgi:N utilization substance protein A
MNNSLLEMLTQLAREKEIPVDLLVDQFKKALAAGYKKHVGTLQEVTVELDPSSPRGFCIFVEKAVVEKVADARAEISLEEAREIDPEVELGEHMDVEENPEDLGRIAAQTVKQVMVQGIREVERQLIYDEYHDRVGEILPAVVQRHEKGAVVVSLSKLKGGEQGKGEAILPRSEQMRGDNYRFGDRLEVYLLRVDETPRNPQIVVSRTHPNLLRRLFEREVPEIHEGVVEIVNLAREAGVRSKVAVATRDANVDPVGACVGHRGSRVQAVTQELADERIDIIRFHADPKAFINEALSPAKISKVILSDDKTGATVIVPDDQQSLAIGRAGQNVRLAARLTGLKLDIRSESQVAAGEQGHTSEP